ncbi:hypothetical protein B1B04_24665, partial [Lysinibacillus sp. KCTC 33748]|uniref:leucine-rich repeat protein n=1 Tax=unclassified Lysinibacillus TaxID=2636778 RepID=UPI0009D1C9F5
AATITEDENTSLNDEGMTNVPKIADDFGIVDRGNGVAIVKWYGNTKDVVIPNEINGKPVIEIGQYAFQQKQLTSVTIPSSVITIGFRAFAYNNQLTSVKIPSNSSLTTIGEQVFYESRLESVEIPESVTVIGERAFQYNRLTSIKIPSNSSLTTIGLKAFSGNLLTSVDFPASVTAIGNGAFDNNQLTSVEIPPKLTTIGGTVFWNNRLTSVKFHENVTAIGAWAFHSNQLTSVDIPSSVTAIGAKAFATNKLTSIEIPPKVTTIEEEVFSMNRLTRVDISSNVTTIEDYAFAMNQLTSVGFNENLTTIGSRAFFDNQLTRVDIPSSVTTIGSSAFSLNQLTRVDIPSNVITIGEKAFQANPLDVVIFHGEHEFQWDKQNYPFAPYKENEKWFIGWWEDEDHTKIWNYSVTKPMTIYAKWRMFVKFDANGGSEVPTQPVVYGELTSVPTAPVKEGYQFDCWYKDKELNHVWDFAEDKVTADITLYAKWTKDYKVTFDSDGGNEIPSQKLGYKALVKPPSNPKKEGNLFIGWYKNKNFTKAWDFDKDVVT